jgi:DNA (cytosine-5)-methyltransferase 1
MAHNNRTRLNTFHLFSGAGGGILADILLGHNPIGACEIEQYPRDVLLARQADGHLPQFPIWDDVATLDGNPWRGSVDILCGGFPCTDLSPARTNNHVNGTQRGLDGKKSGLWSEMARVAREIQPPFIFIENSPNLRGKGLSRVLNDLRSMGYNARWCVLGSKDIGADHHRKRIWILAYSDESQRKGGSTSSRVYTQHANAISANRREDQSEVERVANGVDTGLDKNWGKRLKAIGNGQDPFVAATAFSIMTKGLTWN